MKGCILKLMLIMSLVTTSIELNAQQIMVRILDTTYIPSIIENNESRQSITLSCKNKNFNEILSTFVFKDFEQTFLELKNSKWEQEDIDWFLQVYTFYFLSYDDRDRFLSFLEEYKNIFEGPSVAEAHYRIAANTSTTFNDTQRNEQDYLDYIKFPNAYSIVQNYSTQEKVRVGIVDPEHFDTTHEDYTYKLLVDSFDNDSAKKNHGTLVLGVLGAINNNSNGIVSTGGDVSDIYISADPRGKAMLKVSALADSFNCKVINCSWTGENDNEYVEKLYRNVCDKNDCVVVCSAGNGLYDTTYTNNTDRQYPASFESCLSVTSVNHRNDRHSGIGYHCFDTRNPDSTFQHNDAVDICAPGKYIYTTNTNNTYIHDLGTSFSTPLVSGIVAKVRYVNPCLTARQVMDVLKTTANDTIYKIRENSSYKRMLGTGLVDAGAAVQKAIDLLEPHLYIRDSKKDYGVEPYLGNDYLNSPDIIVKDMDGNHLPENKSWDEDYYLLDVTIRKIGCDGFRINENTQLIATIGATSLLSRFRNVYTNLFQRIFQSTNTPLIANSNGGDITDSVIIQDVHFTAPEVVWGIPIEGTFSSSTISNIPLEHIKFGFNIMAVADEDGLEDSYLRNHLNNDHFYVRAKRNVAMKKGRETITQRHYVRLTELLLTEMPSSLVVRQKHQTDSTILSDNAEVYLWLSDNLIDYLEYPSRLEFVDENRILLTNPNTEISLIPPIEGEYFIGLEVHFFGDEEPQHSIYDVDIELVEEGEVSDAITFTAIRDESVYFNAVASISDSEIMNTQETTLSSNRINNNASYTWFDAAMDTIGRGRQLTVQPDRSQTYTLKIQQESNGYVASDTVSVVVKEGRISAITPNPATMSAMISYEVTPNKSASITITDISNTIRQNYPINQANGTLTISVDNMPKGVYYVTLNVEGAVADTQSLIVQ